METILLHFQDGLETHAMATLFKEVVLERETAANDYALDRALDVSIVIPVFREVDNVLPMIARLQNALEGFAWEAIFVDDDSPDGTADRVRLASMTDRRIRVIQRIGRRGLSSACIEGMCAATAPTVVVIDGDGQHDETIIPDMLREMRSDARPHMVVGSRFIEGGGTGDWDVDRVAKSQFATRLAHRFCGVALSDPMSGFFAVDTATARGLAPGLTGIGFKILLDLASASEEPLRIREIPYVFRTREIGESKLDHVVALEYLFSLYGRTRLARVVPLRFAMFAGVGTMGVGVHMGAMWMLHVKGGIGFSIATLVATLTAICANFLLNNALTYRDRRLVGFRNLSRGFLSFLAVCGTGAIANVGAAAWLHDWRDGSWQMSALAGACVAIVWNFALSGRFTWGRYR